MDTNALIEAICAKVQERIAACETGAGAGAAAQAEEKPAYLVLTEAHGMKCHETLEDACLNAHVSLDCALKKEYNVDAADYDGLVACTLTNENLAKIALGILDTPYTKIFGKAILLGKKIFVPKEEIEFYQYKDTAPKGYYNRYDEYLSLLKQCGAVVVENAELNDAIIGTVPVKYVPPKEDAPKASKEYTVKTKVVSERDVITAHTDEATIIVCDKTAIITDLAKDYAARYGIMIDRRDGIRK